MSLVKCNTCGGVYSQRQADGTDYYHACADVFDETTHTFKSRPDARDENPVLVAIPFPVQLIPGVHTLKARPGETGMACYEVRHKAEGKGVVPV